MASCPMGAWAASMRGPLALPPVPPSAAAHRLAWWLARAPLNFRRLRESAGMDWALVESVLSGEVVPSGGRLDSIARATAGAVRPDDWNWPACGEWTKRPQEQSA